MKNEWNYSEVAAAQIFIICYLLEWVYITTYLKDWRATTILLPLLHNILQPLPHPPGLKNQSHLHSFASLDSAEHHWYLLSDNNHCIYCLGQSLKCCLPLLVSIHWRCCYDQRRSDHQWSPASRIDYCDPELLMYLPADQRLARQESCCYGLQ